MDSQKKLIDGIRKVCICKGIPASSILEAIRGGCLSFEALRRTVGVGTGNCRARRCRAKIEKMVKDYKENQAKSHEAKSHTGLIS